MESEGNPIDTARPLHIVDKARRLEVVAQLATERLATDPAESARLALTAIQLGRSQNNRLATARAMLTLSRAALASGSRPAEVFAPVHVAISEFAELGEQRDESDAHLLLAGLYVEERALSDALWSARRAKSLAQACNDPELNAQADVLLASVYQRFPGHSAIKKARATFEQAAETYLMLSQGGPAAAALLEVAFGCLILQEFEEAFHLASRCLRISADESSRHAMHTVRAVAAAKCGWPARADEDWRHLQRYEPDPSLSHSCLNRWYAESVVRRAKADTVGARALLTAGIQDARQRRDIATESLLQGELSALASQVNDLPTALDAARAEHSTYLEVIGKWGGRVLDAIETSSRFDLERRRSEALIASQAELEQSVTKARTELAATERSLELERSRRSLDQSRLEARPGIEPLTGLPDLAALAGSIRQLLADCARVAVVVITIDDERAAAPMPDSRQVLIREVSARAHGFLRSVPGAIAGSLGSEDLVAVLPIEGTDAELRSLLERLHAHLCPPMEVMERKTSIAIQFGVALAPEHGHRPNGLLSRARLAGRASRHQRPRGPLVAVFTEVVEERQQLRNFVQDNLSKALANNLITVHYQPIVDTASRAALTAEALVRWFDPIRGAIGPADFIPLAEETGQIVELGGYVLKQACCDAAEWRAAPGCDLPIVAVNISASQLLDNVLLAQVDAALLISGLPASRLSLELTETALASSTNGIGALMELRRKGVTIKVDDFGTGYSSFSYLTRFPVDCVKIDKSFVDRIADSPDDASITAAIISMAHALRLEVVAEGVESARQAELLTEQGCDALQGYLFSRPQSAADFRAWLLHAPATVGS